MGWTATLKLRILFGFLLRVVNYGFFIEGCGLTRNGAERPTRNKAKRKLAIEQRDQLGIKRSASLVFLVLLMK